MEIDLADWLTLIALILGPALAAGLVIWRDEKLQKRRTNKMVLMLARELQYMSEAVSALNKDLALQKDSTEVINNTVVIAWDVKIASSIDWDAFIPWRDGLSLEMWKAFRYELDPEPYKCLLEAYKTIEYIIQGKNSTQLYAFEVVLAKGLLDDFNKKYAELSKVCKYYSTV